MPAGHNKSCVSISLFASFQQIIRLQMHYAVASEGAITTEKYHHTPDIIKAHTTTDQ